MYFTTLFTIVTALSGMTSARPLAQAGGPSDYTVHCSTGSCNDKDLEAIATAINLAQTNPEAVSWSVDYKVNDKRVTRDETSAIDPNLVSNCAAGKCSKEDLDSLKQGYDAAKSSDDVSAAALLGSLDFTYRFKYDLGNASAASE